MIIGASETPYREAVSNGCELQSGLRWIEHVRECTAEYQIVGEDRRKEPMACDATEPFQQRVGTRKVKISAERFALVRFSLADGRTHEAKVDERTLHSHSLPVGATFAVVYAPSQPDDVRAVLCGTGSRFH